MTPDHSIIERNSIMERVLLTPEEVAEALHVGRCTVYDLIRTNQLQSFKIGKLRRIPVDAVREFIKRHGRRERRRRMSRNTNGEGSIYQRKDGRWVAAAYVPVVGGGSVGGPSTPRPGSKPAASSENWSTARRRTSRSLRRV